MISMMSGFGGARHLCVDNIFDGHRSDPSNNVKCKFLTLILN
jgi:hypothetical protein